MPQANAASRAGKRHERLRQQHNARAAELYRQLNHRQDELVAQEVADHLLRREIKERKAVIDAELEQMRARMWRAYEQCNQEFRKQERYCKEQRDEASPRLPDGRRLVLSVERMCNTRQGHDLSREPDVLTRVPLGLEESPRPDT